MNPPEDLYDAKFYEELKLKEPSGKSAEDIVEEHLMSVDTAKVEEALKERYKEDHPPDHPMTFPEHLDERREESMARARMAKKKFKSKKEMSTHEARVAGAERDLKRIESKRRVEERYNKDIQKRLDELIRIKNERIDWLENQNQSDKLKIAAITVEVKNLIDKNKEIEYRLDTMKAEKLDFISALTMQKEITETQKILHTFFSKVSECSWDYIRTRERAREASEALEKLSPTLKEDKEDLTKEKGKEKKEEDEDEEYLLS